LGFGLGTVACALAPGYGWLVAARVLTGAFGGVLGSLVLAIVGDAVPESRRGQALGIVMGAFSVASVVGVPLGLYLASHFSWHLPFIVLGVLSLAIWAVIYFVMPDMRGHIGPRPIPFGERAAAVFGLFRSSSVRFALLLTALMMLAVTLFTSPLAGRLSDRYGKVPVFTLFTLATLPVMLVLTRLTPAPLPQVLFLAALLFAVSGRFVPATALATSVVPPQQRGSFMSLNSSVQQLAAGTAAYLAGLIVVKTAGGSLLHFEWVGYMAVVGNLLSLLVVRRVGAAAPVAQVPAAALPVAAE
jgi:predicted MFS family arabinose efflux permease